jgi:hypothetical protein
MYLNEYVLVQIVKERLAERRAEAARRLVLDGVARRTPASPRVRLGRALVRLGDRLLAQEGEVSRLPASP